MSQKARYDREADAIYITLNSKPHAYTKPLDDIRYIDYASDDTPIGIELLAVSEGVDVHDLPNQEKITQLLEDYQIKICV